MLDFIRETALMAGALAKSGRERLTAAAIHVKDTPTDMVTDIDREVERFIIDRVRSKFPDHGFIGEETGRTDAEKEYCWIIDPIDGTTSFIHDFPYWGVSIAVYRRGKPYAGAVFAPALDELFSAEAGKGATLNGRPIRVSKCGDIGSALLGTGFACVRDKRPRNNLEFFCRIVPKLQGIRRDGSAAFDLCQVAAGKYDGYWEFRLKIHDIAAGVVIAREAGALVTDADGGEDLTGNGLVCAAPGIHGTLLAEFAGHDIS